MAAQLEPKGLRRSRGGSGATSHDVLKCVLESLLVAAASRVSKFRVNRSGVGVCHCLACQRRTGSVFAALASFAASYEVFGAATEYVRVGHQGAKFKFRFYPVCGTTVFHTKEGHEHSSVAVAVGAFDDPSFPRPQDSVYDCRRHSWVQLPPGTRKHDKDPT